MELLLLLHWNTISLCLDSSKVCCVHLARPEVLPSGIRPVTLSFGPTLEKQLWRGFHTALNLSLCLKLKYFLCGVIFGILFGAFLVDLYDFFFPFLHSRFLWHPAACGPDSSVN